jgi:hypothetical protein
MTRPDLLRQFLLALLVFLAPSASRSPAASQSQQLQQAAQPVQSESVAYTVSTEAFNNPERGFYQQVDCSSGPLDAARLRGYRSVRHQSLIMCAFLLSDALEGPIGESTLALFQHQMDSVRQAGLKVVLRFAYNYSDSAEDASRDLLLAHLEQLRPYLERNADVIAVLQAGFIGSWGEWAKSRHFGSGELSEDNWRDRKLVFDKLLDVMPATRMVQLRTPDFKYRLAGAGPLASGDAFRSTARARAGHHNDCFLASDNDWGTYRRMSPAGQDYLQADTAYVAMGGETCNFNPPRSDCDSALREMARFHWSYLNSQYHEEVLDAWRGQGCDAEVERRLGYRISLRSGIFERSAAPGGPLHLVLTLQNEGWAAPFNPRAVELVLRSREDGALYSLPLNAEPRFWLPGRTVVLRQTVTLPPSLPPGDYALLLNLPDPAPSLHARSEYAIRLANEDLWEADTGFHRLGATVQVTPF